MKQQYRVIQTFADLQDEKHLYKPGDSFPRPGITVTAVRIAELMSDTNKAEKRLIEPVKAGEVQNA